MSSFILYGIPNCDTVRKARSWFDARNIAYDFYDFKKQGAGLDLLKLWLEELGAEKLINKKGTTWRKLDAAHQTRFESDPAGLASANPSLIRRPVISGPHGLTAGFTSAELARIEKALMFK